MTTEMTTDMTIETATETIHETVREHYAAAAVQASPGHGLLQRPRDDRREPLLRPRARRAARRGRPRVARLRQPDRRRRPPSGRARPRPRVGRRHRRPALGQARRPDRPRVRPRHDRRDARAGPAQCRRGRRHERRVPQGPHRGHPAARRVDRRRHQQLRRQPRRRQAGGLRRDRPRPPARAAGSGISDIVAEDSLTAAAARRARLLSPAASPAPSRCRSSAIRARGGRPDRHLDHAVPHGRRRDDQRDHQGHPSRPDARPLIDLAAPRDAADGARPAAAAATAAADGRSTWPRDSPVHRSAGRPRRADPRRHLLGRRDGHQQEARSPRSRRSRCCRSSSRSAWSCCSWSLMRARGSRYVGRVGAARPARPPQPGHGVCPEPARPGDDHGQPVGAHRGPSSRS